MCKKIDKLFGHKTYLIYHIWAEFLVWNQAVDQPVYFKNKFYKFENAKCYITVVPYYRANGWVYCLDSMANALFLFYLYIPL